MRGEGNADLAGAEHDVQSILSHDQILAGPGGLAIGDRRAPVPVADATLVPKTSNKFQEISIHTCSMLGLSFLTSHARALVCGARDPRWRRPWLRRPSQGHAAWRQGSSARLSGDGGSRAGEEGENVADGESTGTGLGQRQVGLDLIAVTAAVLLPDHVAGAPARSLTMAWALRSVMPTLAAISRSRAPGSRAMHSSTRAWLLRKLQLTILIGYCEFWKKITSFSAHVQSGATSAPPSSPPPSSPPPPSPPRPRSHRGRPDRGLTGIGVPPGPAVSAVLTCRLATYWLPVIPAGPPGGSCKDKTTYDVPGPAASSRSSEGPPERLSGL